MSIRSQVAFIFAFASTIISVCFFAYIIFCPMNILYGCILGTMIVASIYWWLKFRDSYDDDIFFSMYPPKEKRPPILYLIKEGFITLEVLSRWDTEMNRVMKDYKCRWVNCSYQLVFKTDSNGCLIISYSDGSQPLKITDDIIDTFF